MTQANAQLSIEADAAKHTLWIEGAVLQQDMWLYQGDIFIDRSAPDSAINTGDESTEGIYAGGHARGFGLLTPGSLWKNGVIEYQFDGSLSAAQIDRVNIAINHWNLNTRISLRQRSSAYTASALSSDYLLFKAGPGCASWVGRQGGEQTVWISDDCGSGSIVHEIGHALGLLHEHARFDRDNHIEVLLPNVEAGKLANFARISDSVRLLGEYDYDSVMHYGSHFFSGTGEPTLLPRNGVAANRIGQRQSLSTGDIRAINEIYSSDSRLDLQSLYSADQDMTRVQVDVTVESTQGTHELLLELQTDAELAFYESNEPWVCQQSQSHISCRLSQLDGYASSRVWLDVAGRYDFDSHNTGLATGTKDSNPGNNGKPIAHADTGIVSIQGAPIAAAALNDAGEPMLQTGSGAGSNGPVLFILLLFMRFWNQGRVRFKCVFAPV